MNAAGRPATASPPPPTALHVIGSLAQGGAERVLANYISASSLNHSVTTLMASGGHFWADVEAAATDLQSLDLKRWRGLPGRYAATVQRARQAPVLVGWMYHAMLAALWWRRPGQRVIWMVRRELSNTVQDKSTTRAVISLAARCSRFADAIVYVSDAARAQHWETGFRAERNEVIGNGVDATRFQPDAAARATVRAALGLSANAFVIGHVARFRPLKRHDLMLRAFRALNAPDAHLVLIGAGTEDAAAVAQAAGGTLPANVHLLGERADLAQLYTGFDLLTLTSSSEGFPNVLAEAMCAGTRVVSTDVGNARSLIGTTGNLIVEPTEAAIVDAWGQAMHQSSAQRHAIEAAGRSRIAGHFSLDAQVQQLDALIGAMALPDDAAVRR